MTKGKVLILEQYGSKQNVMSGCSNGTRGLSASGYNGAPAPYKDNEIEYVTIASRRCN